MTLRLGIDFGGTKIEAAALDEAGAFILRERIPTPRNYASALDAVSALVERVESGVGARFDRVGMGAPGSISPKTGLIRNANSVWLNGMNFQADLTARLGREVRIANDANCLALSEARDGAAAGARCAFAVIIGTGCGGGLVVDGRIVEGGNGIGGEWGHTPLPWMRGDEYPGLACWCGHAGCLETFVSGTGFCADYARATGRESDGAAIVAAARNGEAAAKAALDRYVDRLGRALAMLCDIVDPEVLVLGGGMSNVAELYAQLPDIIRTHVFSDAWTATIAPARWGDSSGVRGAAWLWD